MKLMERVAAPPLSTNVSSQPGSELALAAGAGTVARIARGEQGWVLDSDPAATVRVAVSCLVEPMTGDLVLVTAAGGVCYVLAVLERDCTQERTIRIDLGGSDLNLRAANVVVEVEKNLELEAENLRTNAELSVQSASTQVVNVTGVSMLNANSIAMEGRQSLTMHTQLGAIQASALLKIDGTQMHFG